MADAKAAIGDMVNYYTHRATDDHHYVEDVPAIVTAVSGDQVTLFLFTLPPTGASAKPFDPKTADPHVVGLSYWRPWKAAAPDLQAHFGKKKEPKEPNHPPPLKTGAAA